MEEFGKKKRVSITIDKNLLEKLEELTVNKSRLIEWLVLEHLENSGFDIKDKIIL
jgi:metal-responsive CopG/Arc/MetJ family transcriptional regulator